MNLNLKSPLKYVLLLLTILGLCSYQTVQTKNDKNITHYVVDCSKVHVKMYWKDDNDIALGYLTKLDTFLSKHGKKLLFAMNGGMFKSNATPAGLYIEKGKIIAPMNTQQGQPGNFYLDKKGIFYLTKDRKAGITTDLRSFTVSKTAYATQSGPMLVINGEIATFCKPGSSNVYKRNAVGILPDGRVLFAMSSSKINFYDFALYFKKQGCINALYLDGFNSNVLIPGKTTEGEHVPYTIIIGVYN
jgi:uncharacterized protein YigE (DUF2233 family)